MLEIIQASTQNQFAEGRKLFEQYATSLPFDLDFQGFASELENISDIYSPPEGALLLAIDNEKENNNENIDGAPVIGCVGVRLLENRSNGNRIGEVKRLYVSSAYRGRNIGYTLTAEIIKTADRLGFTSLRLDSMRFMKSAISLYRQFGFVDIEPYRYNPFDDAIFLELIIQKNQ